MAEIRIVRRDAAQYIALPVTFTRDTLDQIAGQAFVDLQAYLASRGVTPEGPGIMRYRAVDADGVWSVDCGFVVQEMPWIEPPFEAQGVPEGMYAVIAQHGPYAWIASITEELLTWIEARGLDVAVEWGEHGAAQWVARHELYLDPHSEGPHGPEGSVEVCMLLAG